MTTASFCEGKGVLGSARAKPETSSDPSAVTFTALPTPGSVLNGTVTAPSPSKLRSGEPSALSARTRKTKPLTG